jgi:hypothetical protein
MSTMTVVSTRYRPLDIDSLRDVQVKRYILTNLRELEELIRISGFVDALGNSDSKTRQIRDWIEFSSEQIRTLNDPDTVFQRCIDHLKRILTHDGTNATIPLEPDTVLGSDGHAYGPRFLSIFQMTAPESIRNLSPLDYAEDPTPLTTRAHTVVRDTINWLSVKYEISLTSEQIEVSYARLSGRRLAARAEQTPEARLAARRAENAQLRARQASAAGSALAEAFTRGAASLNRAVIASGAGVRAAVEPQDTAHLDVTHQAVAAIAPEDVALGVLEDETTLLAQVTANMRVALDPLFNALATEHEASPELRAHEELQEVAPETIAQLRRDIQTFNENTQAISLRNQQLIAAAEHVGRAQDENQKQLTQLDAQIAKVAEAQKEIEVKPPNTWITLAVSFVSAGVCFFLSPAAGPLLGLHMAAGGGMGAWAGHDLQKL